MIKISIIIPVYGVEKYISRCLNSVINQTLKDIEIIIVNDGTKDNSVKICEEFMDKDKRISLYNKKNEGLGLTRNYGLLKAKGEYIAFLDSDDYIDDDFYEKLYNSAKKYNADASFTNYKIVNRDNKIWIDNRSNIPFKEECMDSKWVLFNMLKVPTKFSKKRFLGMSVWRSIYKKEIIEKNNIKFVSEREYISEDIFFNMDFLFNSNKISFIDNTYYYYCENDNSLTRRYTEDKFIKNKKMHNRLIEKTKEMGIYGDVSIGINNSFLDRVRWCIKEEFYNNYNNSYVKVKEILNDSDVIFSVNKKSKEGIRKNIFDYFIKNKNIKMLSLMCNIRNNIKN